MRRILIVDEEIGVAVAVDETSRWWVKAIDGLPPLPGAGRGGWVRPDRLQIQVGLDRPPTVEVLVTGSAS